jgi:DNA modification methylase
MAQNTAMFPIEHEFVFVFGRKRVNLNLTVENKTPGTRTGITNRQKDGTLKRAETKEIRTHRPLGTIFRSPPHIGIDIGHPAMFPVELPVAYIEACSKVGDFIVEPFSGSGTTLVACERLGRKGRAIEIAPKYVAVALQRLADMGLKPKLLK